MNHRIKIIKPYQIGDKNSIKDAIGRVVDGPFSDVLPDDKDASVLLKPNLNSNMNALTGNTTDLRILGSVIEYLKDKGYRRIIIGEGTNSGFYRNRIGVISRLKVDALAGYYGVEVRDLNYSKGAEIDFSDGVKADVAKECVEAGLFINLPKLKTHFEVGMSVCLKNLMGCLIGQENKKKTHQALAANILRLNMAVRPHLHIVDGLIAMEGLGPTRGEPVLLNAIIIGTDPYLIDLICARIAGFDYKAVRTLGLAEKKGLLTTDHHRFAEALDLADIKRSFKPPKANPFAGFIHSPKRQKFFLAIRNTGIFSYLASTDWFGKCLFLTGLRQDVFTKEDMDCQGLFLNRDMCRRCGLCRVYCPLGLDMPEYLNDFDERCIKCLYCYIICPDRAIRFEGKFGFFGEQIRQYDAKIREFVRKHEDIST